jgi:uncharacterized RmlC-like cupin family protein
LSERRHDLPGECYSWEKPVFEYAPVSGLTRRLFIAPETCPTRCMSIWIVHLDRQRMKASDDTFDIHDGVEEAIYGLKGRMKVSTPNENRILKPGGFVWIPAGMPHMSRPLQDRAVFMAIYSPARSGRERNRLVSGRESKRIARDIVRKTASWHRAHHK